jgi:hypothetical protein
MTSRQELIMANSGISNEDIKNTYRIIKLAFMKVLCDVSKMDEDNKQEHIAIFCENLKSQSIRGGASGRVANEVSMNYFKFLMSCKRITNNDELIEVFEMVHKYFEPIIKLI